MVTGFEKVLLAVLILVLMGGMGASLDRQQITAVARRPVALIVGVLSQFGWMPLIAFGLAKLFQLPDTMALGLLVVGCTPGGTTSNLFAYVSRADVALSVAMTAFSTAVAVVAMPAVLSLYASGFSSADFVIPVKDIVITLLVVLLPVGIGVAVRAFRPGAAAIMERVGAWAGALVLILLVGSALFKNYRTFLEIPVGGFAAAILLGVMGMGLGYVAARFAGLDVASRRAVSLETGIQNSPLALAILVATFPDDGRGDLLWIPLLYALCVLISASLVSLWFRNSA